MGSASSAYGFIQNPLLWNALKPIPEVLVPVCATGAVAGTLLSNDRLAGASAGGLAALAVVTGSAFYSEYIVYQALYTVDLVNHIVTYVNGAQVVEYSALPILQRLRQLIPDILVENCGIERVLYTVPDSYAFVPASSLTSAVRYALIQAFWDRVQWIDLYLRTSDSGAYLVLYDSNDSKNRAVLIECVLTDNQVHVLRKALYEF